MLMWRVKAVFRSPETGVVIGSETHTVSAEDIREANDKASALAADSPHAEGDYQVNFTISKMKTETA